MSSETSAQRSVRHALGSLFFALALAFGFAVVSVAGAAVLAMPGILTSY